MRLTDEERAMLDGAEGPARQRAMELLVQYGEALGAERLVETNNVCGTMGASTPFARRFAAEWGGIEAVFAEFNLDSPKVLEIPRAKAFTCHLIQGTDPDNLELFDLDPEVYPLHVAGEAMAARIGMQLMNTCTPYMLGNLPVRGEHCAWMESSAVIYINSVLGARTNTEGRESIGAAMLTGRIPCWGYHLDENRLGTHLVTVDIPVESVMDWNLLGYWVGEAVQERVPVIQGSGLRPTFSGLKHFGAAAASSGGVEMYHIVGVTPEAPTPEAAFGGRAPLAELRYGEAERRDAHHHLNSSARDPQVDLVVLGCPHYSLEQLWQVAGLLDGRRLHDGTDLWIFTPRGLKTVADRNGYTEVITRAGAHLLTDTCPALGEVMPKGTRVVATDSAKQAHYLPAIMNVQTYFGSQEACVEAAVTGRWTGGLR